MLVNIITLHLQLLYKCNMCWSTKFVIKVLKSGMLELVYINKLKMNQFWAGRILSPYLWVPCSAHVLLYYINVIVVHCKVVARQVYKCVCKEFLGCGPSPKKTDRLSSVRCYCGEIKTKGVTDAQILQVDHFRSLVGGC